MTCSPEFLKPFRVSRAPAHPPLASWRVLLAEPRSVKRCSALRAVVAGVLVQSSAEKCPIVVLRAVIYKPAMDIP